MIRCLDKKWFLLAALGCAPIGGCNQTQAQPEAAAPPPPEVEVSLPVTRTVTEFEEFPGRVEAVHSIEIRSRVSGYLDKMSFTEGMTVKEGDPLFEIDARPYKAELARAEANLVLAQAHLTRLQGDYQRAAGLVAKGAIGREEFDKIDGDRAEAAASVGVADANKDLALLNVKYTSIHAPISGRISRRFIDPGNLVKADETPLTLIVAEDPMFAYFDLDERTTLRLQRLMRSGKMSWTSEAGMAVKLALADEEQFGRDGRVNFADNRVDADTGTWRLRAKVANPDHALTPGLFVRVRLFIGAPYEATLVAEQALGTDQGQKYLYVIRNKIDPKTKEAVADPKSGGPVKEAEYRRVKVGRLQDGLRVIAEGLRKDEQVVVSGLQRIRPKDPAVTPKPIKMPEPAAKGLETGGSVPETRK